MENEPETIELDELYWFVQRKPRTGTRENLYVLTMVTRLPRQLVGYKVSMDKTAASIQSMVDTAPEAKRYCTDGYAGYLDVVFPGRHIHNTRDKSDTYTVEGVNADLRHYLPTLARRSRCFPRKAENLQDALTVFAQAYNRFGTDKLQYRHFHPSHTPPFSFLNFL